MKQKTKLFVTIASMCLVLCLVVVGILAVKTLNMSVGGNITFTAEGLDFSISDGTFETTAGAAYPGVNSDSTKLKGFAMNTNTPESAIKTQKESWTGLSLTMSSLGDVVLVFTVTNNMTEKLAVDISVTTLGTNNINSNMDIEVAGGVVEKNYPQKMKITFHIKDTSINAGLTGFGVSVHFMKVAAGTSADYPLDANDAPYLIFAPITETTASVDIKNATGNVVIPSYVRINSKTYTVVKLLNFNYVTLPMTGLTSLHMPATLDASNTADVFVPELETLYFEVDPSVYVGKIRGLFNYTEFVYVRSNITVANSSFTKQAESEIEGYEKYTETIYDMRTHGGASN